MTDALFSDADLFGYDQVDVFEAVEEQLAEDAVEAERVAAADAEAIDKARALITADLPEGAAERITATLGNRAEAPVDLVAEVKAHAIAHYARGWDVVVECKTDGELAEMIGDADTVDAAVASVAEWVGLMEETRLNQSSGDVDERGPWGVFESDLCIALVSDRRTADALAEEARAADDDDSEVVVWAMCREHLEAEQPRRTCEECTTDGADEDEAAPGSVDVDALRLTPSMREMILDIDAGPWHYQTRHKAHVKKLVTDIKATSLTEFGERVRTALLAL